MRQLQVPKHNLALHFDPLVSSDNHEVAKAKSEGRQRAKSRTPNSSPPSGRKHSPRANRHTGGSPSSRAKLGIRLQPKSGSKTKLNQAQAYPERVIGGEGSNAQLDIAQNSIITNELEQRKEEYCSRESIRVFVGTWNVNGKSPDERLTPYIGRGSCHIREDATGNAKYIHKPQLVVLG